MRKITEGDFKYLFPVLVLAFLAGVIWSSPTVMAYPTSDSPVVSLETAALKEAPGRLPSKPGMSDDRIQAALGRLPLYFEENRGQTTDPRVKFKAKGKGYTLYVTPEETVVVMSDGRDGQPAVRMRLVGADTSAKIDGLDKRGGIVNYLLGNDESKWVTEIPTYGRVRYNAVYPGTDLVYYGNQGRIEYDFILEPGADPGRIKMDITGARSLNLDGNGALVIETAAGRLIQPAPVVYQKVQGQNLPVPCQYQLLAENRIGFKVAAYDPSKKLVIDPKLEFSSFLGSSSSDLARAIWAGELDDGNTYVFLAGETQAKDFPDADPFPGADAHNAFVVKLQWMPDTLNLNMVYSTYLGAEEPDWINDIVVDYQGNVYATGQTDSAFFIVANGFQNNCHYWAVPCGDPGYSTEPTDAFISVLDPLGTSLSFSTYVGTEKNDVGNGIDIDAAGNIYVSGRAKGQYLGNFFFSGAMAPLEAYHGCWVLPLDPINPEPSCEDAFLIKLTPAVTGYNVDVLTYLGGGGVDIAHSVAVDGTGNIYVAGQTDSCEVSGTDYCDGLARAPNFPTVNAFQDRRKGRTDAFVTKFNATGTITYSSYFGGYFPTLIGGGAPDELMFDIEIQRENSVDYLYAGGYTWSDSVADAFPIVNAYQDTIGGFEDGYIAKMDLSQTGAGSLIWCTYLGGNKEDRVFDIELDFQNGRPIVYVTGRTRSYEIASQPKSKFPTSANTFQSQLAGSNTFDAFLSKFEATGTPEVLSMVYSTYFGGTSDENWFSTYEVAPEEGTYYVHRLGVLSVHDEIAYIGGVTGSSDFHTSAPYQSSLNGGADAFVAMFVKQIGSGTWTGLQQVTGNKEVRAVSAYAGNYSGTFTGSLEDDPTFDGVWAFTVDNNGKIAGTTTVNGGDTYDISGTVNALGEVTISNWAGTGGTALAVIDGAGGLVGTWSTEDIVPPQVIAFTPPDGASQISPNATITATLDTRVLTSSIKNAFVLTNQTGGGAIVNGDVTYDPMESKLTFRVNDPAQNPDNPTQLLVSTDYQASIEPGITDLSGNMAQDYIYWSFTTSSDPFTPVVSPVENATSVALDAIMTATFTPASRRILADTVDETSFYLRNDTDGVPVDSVVDYTNSDPGAVAFVARLTPTGGLIEGKKYTATLTTAITDIDGEHLQQNYSWSFTTVGSFNVVSTSPSANEANVSRTTPITATFDDDLDDTTVNANTFFVNNQQITGAVTYNNRVATFTPDTALAVPGTYAVNLTTGIQNLSGNSLPGPYTWVFTTGTAVDTTAPTVTATSPLDQATDVAITATASATFDKDLDASTVNGANFYLTANGQTVAGTVTYDFGTRTILFTPASNLDYETDYVATISSQIKGANGTNLAATQTFSFSTEVDPTTQPPNITGVVPLENATAIDVATTITATFDRDMDAASINQTNTSLARGANPVAYQIAYDAGTRTATITPNANLAYESEYTATFTTGVRSSNNINMLQNKTWTFTTEEDPTTTPPEVNTTTPADGAVDVHPGDPITIVFTKDMDATALNANTVLVNDGTQNIALNFSYDQPTRTLTVTPGAGYLKISTQYTLTVTTGATDIYGITLTADFQASFTTASSPDLAPPEVTQVFPGANAVNVAVSTIVTRTFDKAMDEATLTTNTFRVADTATGTAVAGTVTYNAAMFLATFTPNSALAYDTNYTVTLTTGVTGANGAGLAANHVTRFTTEAEPVKPNIPGGGGGGGGCFLSITQP